MHSEKSVTLKSLSLSGLESANPLAATVTYNGQKIGSGAAFGI
ncbi:MAG: hypothetical protein AAFY99_14285 [Pseudomonadota bacterium]